MLKFGYIQQDYIESLEGIPFTRAGMLSRGMTGSERKSFLKDHPSLPKLHGGGSISFQVNG